MPGKISELPTMTDPVSTDLIEVLDVSDTSMAPTGTNKRMALALVATGPEGPEGPPGPPGDWSVPQSINTQTGGAYDLVLADAGKIVMATHPTGFELYIPNNATVPFPIGSRVDLLQGNTAQIVVYARAGVTIHATPSNRTRMQWSVAGVLKIDTDEWVLMGDLYPL